MNIKIIGLFTFIFFIFSCTEKIELPLSNHTPQLTIQGEITDIDDTAFIYLSLSQPFNSQEPLTKVAADSIFITDNLGNNFPVLASNELGKYYALVKGIIGNTYFLNLYYQGKKYSAQSKMPNKVMIDSVYTIRFFGAKPDERINVFVINDPVEKNYYRTYNSLDKNIEVIEDVLFNGDKSYSFYPGRNFVKIGDTVDMYLLNIDRANFEYWRALLQNTTLRNSNSAAPANPPSNISGGAFGYFSAHSVDTARLIVK